MCCRRRAEQEEALIAAEVERQLAAAVEERVREALGSAAVQQSLADRLTSERARMEAEVGGAMRVVCNAGPGHLLFVAAWDGGLAAHHVVLQVHGL